MRFIRLATGNLTLWFRRPREFGQGSIGNVCYTKIKPYSTRLSVLLDSLLPMACTPWSSGPARLCSRAGRPWWMGMWSAWAQTGQGGYTPYAAASTHWWHSWSDPLLAFLWFCRGGGGGGENGKELKFHVDSTHIKEHHVLSIYHLHLICMKSFPHSSTSVIITLHCGKLCFW